MYVSPIVFGFSCVLLQCRSKQSIIPPINPKTISERQADNLKQKLPQIMHLLLQTQDPKEQCIVEPFLQIIKRKGKRIRPLVVKLMAQLFESRENYNKIVYLIAFQAEILHNASLIIDDIEDKSEQRRGETCIHKIFGVDRAVNAANYAYFKPFRNLLKHLPPSKTLKFQQIFLEQMTNLHLGQAQDIYCHKLPFDSQKWPQLVGNHDTYIRMVASKTGGLLRMMARWVCCLFDSSSFIQQCLVSCMDNLAISFQIRDDLANLTNTMGKGIYGEDIHQRKITLMIINTLQKHNAQFVRLFGKPTKTEKQAQRIIQILHQSGSMAYAERECISYGQKSLEMLKRLDSSLQLQQLYSAIHMIIHRSS